MDNYQTSSYYRPATAPGRTANTAAVVTALGVDVAAGLGVGSLASAGAKVGVKAGAQAAARAGAKTLGQNLDTLAARQLTKQTVTKTTRKGVEKTVTRAPLGERVARITGEQAYFGVAETARTGGTDVRRLGVEGAVELAAPSLLRGVLGRLRGQRAVTAAPKVKTPPAASKRVKLEGLKGSDLDDAIKQDADTFVKPIDNISIEGPKLTDTQPKSAVTSGGQKRLIVPPKGGSFRTLDGKRVKVSKARQESIKQQFANGNPEEVKQTVLRETKTGARGSFEVKLKSKKDLELSDKLQAYQRNPAKQPGQNLIGEVKKVKDIPRRTRLMLSTMYGSALSLIHI